MTWWQYANRILKSPESKAERRLLPYPRLLGGNEKVSSAFNPQSVHVDILPALLHRGGRRLPRAVHEWRCATDEG